jgi:hypothetical protein
MFNTDEFKVYMMSSGEVVTEEWTGKKHIQKSFLIN